MSASIFLLLRPERVGLTPNPLDPFFYTGYAINFDDILREVGDLNYFVSRWSVYMPGRAFSWVFGPTWGRLVLRWCVASACLVSLWHLGKRWRWNRPTELLIGLIALTNPMLARAFMTDYVEWFVVSVGLILVCQCLERRATSVRSASIGAISALLIVANPYAFSILIPAVAVYLIAILWRNEPSVKQGILVGSGFASTIVVGLLAFGVFYDIPNVYAPTVDFLKTSSGKRDGLKSPNLRWMLSFVWIYLPPLLVGAALFDRRLRKTIRRSPSMCAVFGLLLIQYSFQILDQFVRDGDGLEVSYYWSSILPTFTLAIAALMGCVRWGVRGSLFAGFAWLAGLYAFSSIDLRLPLAVLGVCSTAGLVAGFRFGGRSVAPIVASLLGLCLILQLAPPPYDPLGYHDVNVDPLYADVFLASGSQSQKTYQEAVWMADQLDGLPSDVGISFLPGVKAIAATAIYGPQVNGRLVSDLDDPIENARIGLGTRPLIAIFGSDQFVQRSVAQIELISPDAEPVLDRIDPRGFGLRLVVVEVRGANSQGVTIAAGSLAGAGTVDVEGERLAVPGGAEPGFVMFGPFIALKERRYRATFVYRSDAARSESDGSFDVAESGTMLSTQLLVGTEGKTSSVSVDFDGTSDNTFEFRCLWSGVAALELDSVIISELTP